MCFQDVAFLFRVNACSTRVGFLLKEHVEHTFSVHFIIKREGAGLQEKEDGVSH